MTPTRALEVVEHRMVIGDELRLGSDGSELDCIDPFTGGVSGTIPDASPDDVVEAVARARQAFTEVWRHTPGWERGRWLGVIADVLDEHGEDLARLETQDNGKPFRETLPQMRFAARLYRYYAGYADKIQGHQIPLDQLDRLDYTLREPVGVVALITAWNSPMQLLANKLAPALAAGNTCVVKPSELASTSTLTLGRLLLDRGFPAGVVNVVSGGLRAGAALSSHPAIDHLSFTGSVETGRAIGRATAETIVPTTLELGGKSANIIFADADLDRAVIGATVGIFTSSGQACIAGSRLLVHSSIHDEVVDRIGRRAEAIRLGDPFDASTQMGPLANGPHFENVRTMVATGVRNGAELVTGGQPLDSSLALGLFVRPAVFAGVSTTMEIAQQEIFGPVLSVLSFDDDDEAVQIANSTQLGLASALWTNDLTRAHRTARALEAGTVWVNTYREAAAQAPFGGVRLSGHGRERGLEAIEPYLRTKNVLIDLSGSTKDPYAEDPA